jgi:hypothetical protein
MLHIVHFLNKSCVLLSVRGYVYLVKECISFLTGSTGGDGDRRRMGPNIMQQYPDNQQLFMGNLPHHATEDDLKVILTPHLAQQSNLHTIRRAHAR